MNLIVLKGKKYRELVPPPLSIGEEEEELTVVDMLEKMYFDVAKKINFIGFEGHEEASRAILDDADSHSPIREEIRKGIQKRIDETYRENNIGIEKRLTGW